MKLNKKQEEDLRGVFFIVKGQYKRNCGQSFVNSATGDVNYLGGYDPSSEETSEWYMVLDNITFNCVCCGSDFNRAVRSIGNAIKRYKTKARYLKELKRRDPRNNVSKPMRCLYEAIYNTYGDFYSDYIEEQEDLAYGDITFKTPLQRTKDIKKKTTVRKLVTPTTTEKKDIEVSKTLRRKAPLKRSLKKLSI